MEKQPPIPPPQDPPIPHSLQEPFKPTLTPADPEKIKAFNQAQHDARVQTILQSANIPRAFAESASELLAEQDGWMEALADLTNHLPSRQHQQPGSFGGLVCLTGPRGCGKTTLAIEAMRFCANLKMFVYFDAAESFIRRAGSRDADEEQLRADYFDPKLLVLDEVAKLGDSGWEERKLFWVVNDRYQNQKHTILTCSAQPHCLDQVLPASILDRLNGQGSAVIHLNWESFRK